jgi:hypothetical protein
MKRETTPVTFRPVPLEVSEYRTTDAFKAIPAHVAVAVPGYGKVVAVTGPAGDANALRYAQLFVAAPALLRACERILVEAKACSCSEGGHCAYCLARDAIGKAASTSEGDAAARQLALHREFVELLADMAEFWANGTPIHPGSDLATNARSLLRIVKEGR